MSAKCVAFKETLPRFKLGREGKVHVHPVTLPPTRWIHPYNVLSHTVAPPLPLTTTIIQQLNMHLASPLLTT